MVLGYRVCSFYRRCDQTLALQFVTVAALKYGVGVLGAIATVKSEQFKI